MRFTFAGKEYRLGFRREYVQVHRPIKTHPNGDKVVKLVRTPKGTTEAFLLEVTGPRTYKHHATATVKCYIKDKFTKEEGRQWALKALKGILGEQFTDEFKTALQDAYDNRPRQPKKVKEKSHGQTKVPTQFGMPDGVVPDVQG